MNDLVLPEQEKQGGYLQDSILGICNSTGDCTAIDQMKQFAVVTGMNDLVLPKQEKHGGYLQDSIFGYCNSTGDCTAIDELKDFVTDINKNQKYKTHAMALVERYGKVL